MLVGWQEAPGDKPPGHFRMMVWMIDGADLSVGSIYFTGICWDTSDVGHNRWDIVEAVIVTTACNPFGASRVLLRRTLGNPFIAPIRYVGITHYIGGRSRSNIFASSPHSPDNNFSVAEMRVSSQLLLVLFAISAAVNAYVIPKGGKYPSFIAKSFCKLTTVLFTGEEDRDIIDTKPAVRMSDGF